mmetsp:Transcript_40793/g.89181  ORF Transcript_40793/g.89181 Transcript_40793/m.89181 type:complete len:339 (-) Transcript_40793:88-1104(-)
MGWGQTLLASAESLESATWPHTSSSPSSAMSLTGVAALPRSHVGAWLLQQGHKICVPGDDAYCKAENLHILATVAFLCIAIVTVTCIFTFIREDKEEQITPLCPQLIVKEGTTRFKLSLEDGDEAIDVTDFDDKLLCRVAMDWPDPFRPATSGVAATVRLQSQHDLTLATVVARNVAVVGQGLALCRAGCEIFGFVEPDLEGHYLVKHRTGVHLLTLIGNFGDDLDVEMVNPVGLRVCSIRKVDGVCVGTVCQHVDAGLVICSLFAVHVNRRLLVRAPPSPWDTIITPRSARRPEDEAAYPAASKRNSSTSQPSAASAAVATSSANSIEAAPEAEKKK